MAEKRIQAGTFTLDAYYHTIVKASFILPHLPTVNLQNGAD